MPVLLLPLAGWALSLQLVSGEVWTLLALVAAVVAAVLAWICVRTGKECPVSSLGVFLLLAAPRFSAPSSR